MISYSFKSIISIADFIPTDPELILSMLKRRLRDESGLPENRGISCTNVKLDIDNTGDVDKFTIKCMITYPREVIDDYIERKIRKFMTSVITRFSELDIESVAYKIDYLDLEYK